MCLFMANDGSPRKCYADPPPRPLIRCVCIGKDALSMPVAKFACALQDHLNSTSIDPTNATEPIQYKFQINEMLFKFHAAANDPNRTRESIRKTIIDVFAILLPAFNWTNQND